MIIPNICTNKSHVPNHQPDLVVTLVIVDSNTIDHNRQALISVPHLSPHLEIMRSNMEARMRLPPNSKGTPYKSLLAYPPVKELCKYM